MPKWIDLKAIVSKANIDLDYIDTLDVEIPHPWSVFFLTTKNADGEKKYDISIETQLSLTKTANATAMNVIS